MQNTVTVGMNPECCYPEMEAMQKGGTTADAGAGVKIGNNKKKNDSVWESEWWELKNNLTSRHVRQLQLTTMHRLLQGKVGIHFHRETGGETSNEFISGSDWRSGLRSFQSWRHGLSFMLFCRSCHDADGVLCEFLPFWVKSVTRSGQRLPLHLLHPFIHSLTAFLLLSYPCVTAWMPALPKQASWFTLFSSFCTNCVIWCACVTHTMCGRSCLCVSLFSMIVPDTSVLFTGRN